MNEAELLDHYEIPPHVDGSDTSKAAAVEIKSSTAQIRERIVDVMRRAGAFGATCDEIECILRLAHQTASARIWELRDRGLIVDSLARRRTRSGRKAVVWVAL